MLNAECRLLLQSIFTALAIMRSYLRQGRILFNQTCILASPPIKYRSLGLGSLRDADDQLRHLAGVAPVFCALLDELGEALTALLDWAMLGSRAPAATFTLRFQMSVS